MTNYRREVLEVWTKQVLLPDASVYSRQWLRLPTRFAAIAAHELLARYLGHIRQCTFGLLKPVAGDDGISFRLLNSQVSLLIFAPPEFRSDSRCCSVTLCLSGGLLVQRDECGRGMFCLEMETNDGGSTIAVQLSDYCPLLLRNRKPSRIRKQFYRLTQAFIHKVVTIKYLARLHRDLTGKKLPITVKKVAGPEGEEI